MAGTGGTHVLVLAAVVLLAAAAVAERRPRVRRTPQGLGGLQQSYDFSPSNLNLGASAPIGPTLSDFGGLGGLSGLSGINSGLNFGGSGGYGSFGGVGGGLNYNFDLGGQSNSFGSDFNFPNYGGFPQLGGQNKPSPYIPPVSRVLKEGINAFLPAGAKKILPGDKAYIEFESAISDEPPKLEPIIKNLGGKNPFDVIRQTATNPLQTAFTRVIDDPTYSPLPFPKSVKEQTKELTRHVEQELLKVDKQLTAEEKNTQNIYQSIDGVSLATSSSSPVRKAVASPDGKGHESSSSTSNYHQVVPPPENYVSHDGFPITDDSKFSPFQSQSKITSAISMKEQMLKIPGRVEPKTVPILPPPKHFDEVSSKDKHTTIGLIEVKQPYEIKTVTEPQPADPKPEMVRHLFAKPGVHPQKLEPIGRPEHSIAYHKLQGQESGHIINEVPTASNIIKPTPRPEPEDDFYLGLFPTRRPTAVTKPSFATKEELFEPNIAGASNSRDDDRHSDILQQFGLKPLPKPPAVEATELLSGAEILLLVKKSNPPPPFQPSGDFSLGSSTTVETIVPPEVKSEQTSEIKEHLSSGTPSETIDESKVHLSSETPSEKIDQSKVHLSSETPSEKIDETKVHLSSETPSGKIEEASLPVPTQDEANTPIAMKKLDSLDLSEIEGADRDSASSRDTPILEVRDVIDSPDIPVTTPTNAHLKLSDNFGHAVITNETNNDTDLKFQNRANNLSLNVSTDINDKIKRHSNERPETSSEASNDEIIEPSVIERPVLESVAKQTLESRDFALTVLEAPTTPEIQQVFEPKSVDVFRLTAKPYSEEITKNGSTSIKYSEELDASYFVGFGDTPNNVTTERNVIPFDDISILPSLFSNFSSESVSNYSNPYLKSIYVDRNSHFEQPSFRISKSVTRPSKPFSTTKRTYPLRTIFPPSKFVSRPTTKPWSPELNNVSVSNLDERLEPNSEDGLLNLSYFAGKSLVNIPIYKLSNMSRDLGIRNSSHEFSSSQFDNLKTVPLLTLEKFKSPNLSNENKGKHSPEYDIKIDLSTQGSSVPLLKYSTNVERKATSDQRTTSLSSLLRSNAIKSAQLKEDTVIDLSPPFDRVKLKDLSFNRNITTISPSNLYSDITEKYRGNKTRNHFISTTGSINRKGDKLVSSPVVQSFSKPLKNVEVSTQRYRISALLERPDESTGESKKPRREVWSSSRFNDKSVIRRNHNNRRTTLQKPFHLTKDTSTVLPPPDAQIRSSASQVQPSSSRLFNRQSFNSEKTSLWPITSFVRYSSNYNGSKSELNNNSGFVENGRSYVVVTNSTTKRSQALPPSPLTGEGDGYRKIVHFPSGNNDQSKELSKFLTMELFKINSDNHSSNTTDNLNLRQEVLPFSYSENSLNEIPITREFSSAKLSPSTEASLKTRERKELLSRSGDGLSERHATWSSIANVTSHSSSTGVTEGGVTITYTTDTDPSVSPSLLSKAGEIIDQTTPSATKSPRDETTADSKTISLKLTGFRTEKPWKIVK